MTETKAVCVLCAMWDRMPHAKRWSTPVMPHEAEHALSVGYWLRARQPQDAVARLCERHAILMDALDQAESHRAAPLPVTQNIAQIIVNAPPVDDGPVTEIPPKETFQCPICHKMVTLGEMHPCE